MVHMTAATVFSLQSQLLSAGSVCRKRPAARQKQRMRSPLAQQVLEFLAAQQEYKRQHEVREGTGLRHSAACWALLLLRKHGLVDAVPDGNRNARYLRYKAKVV